jgi:hypothetical protein
MNLLNQAISYSQGIVERKQNPETAFLYETPRMSV